MKHRIGSREVGAAASVVLALALFGLVARAQAPGQAPQPPASPTAYPAWAYPWAPSFAVPTPDNTPQRLSGSAATFTWTQARDLFFAPDWRPESHPTMPSVVARGRAPEVRACGSCHRAEGTGGPESASLSGLPVVYFAQQIADFKSGARRSSAPQRTGAVLMDAVAKAVTDDEVQAAAAYFAGLKPQRIIKVVESEVAPKTYIARLYFAKSPEGGSEALGRRIVEVPDDVEQFELRDTQSTFTAYVPPGSLGRGAALANGGGPGAAVACASCHGADLKGMGAVPRIAGRSPSYLMRQLFDFKAGVRAGSGSAQMRSIVAYLSEDDLLALAAYVASLPP